MKVSGRRIDLDSDETLTELLPKSVEPLRWNHRIFTETQANHTNPAIDPLAHNLQVTARNPDGLPSSSPER